MATAMTMLYKLPNNTRDYSKPVYAVIQKAEVLKPVEYIVKENDSLAKIAKDQNTNIERLWEKNTQLENPDVIKPGDKLVIPKPDEPLVDRPLPEPVIIQSPATNRSQMPDPPTKYFGVAGTSLIGNIGYAIHTGNCVDTARAYGKVQPGNPISWVPSTQEPFIGAAALFQYNHVGIVVGIWPNGDLEIIHENYRGMEHRFPRSDFRGFF